LLSSCSIECCYSIIDQCEKEKKKEKKIEKKTLLLILPRNHTFVTPFVWIVTRGKRKKKSGVISVKQCLEMSG
jgi:hypothetical protein